MWSVKSRSSWHFTIYSWLQPQLLNAKLCFLPASLLRFSRSSLVLHNRQSVKRHRTIFLPWQQRSLPLSATSPIRKFWINLASASFWQLSKRVYAKCNLAIRTKTAACNAACISTLLHGYESLTPCCKLITSLKAFHIRCWQIIRNLCWRNKVVHTEVRHRAELAHHVWRPSCCIDNIDCSGQDVRKSHAIHWTSNGSSGKGFQKCKPNQNPKSVNATEDKLTNMSGKIKWNLYDGDKVGHLMTVTENLSRPTNYCSSVDVLQY